MGDFAQVGPVPQDALESRPWLARSRSNAGDLLGVWTPPDRIIGLVIEIRPDFLDWSVDDSAYASLDSQDGYLLLCVRSIQFLPDILYLICTSEIHAIFSNLPGFPVAANNRHCCCCLLKHSMLVILSLSREVLLIVYMDQG